MHIPLHCKLPGFLNLSEIIFEFLCLKMNFVLMQKEKTIIHTLSLDFGFLSISLWTTIKNVRMAHCNVHGLRVKFCSGFQVSYNSKLESTAANCFVTIWSVPFQCSTSRYSGHLGARKGQWGNVMWEFASLHVSGATSLTWWETVPEAPRTVSGAGQRREHEFEKLCCIY